MRESSLLVENLFVMMVTMDKMFDLVVCRFTLSRTDSFFSLHETTEIRETKRIFKHTFAQDAWILFWATHYELLLWKSPQHFLDGQCGLRWQ